MKGQGRILPVLAVALCLMLLTFGVASAITNGVPDGENHPYVAAIILTDGAQAWSCSGSLIAPRVVLTAGHCTSGATRAMVSFDSVYSSDMTFYSSADLRTLDGFCTDCGKGLPGYATHDVGLVILPQVVTDKDYASLPTENQLATLPKKSAVDLVGYGAQVKVGTGVPPAERWTWLYPARFYAPAQFINDQGPLGDEFMKVTANPGQGKGGSCFGDSGGPVLLAGSNVILGINSFGANANCAGVNYATRIDTTEVRNWITANLP